jgi:hypothetical protein
MKILVVTEADAAYGSAKKMRNRVGTFKLEYDWSKVTDHAGRIEGDSNGNTDTVAGTFTFKNPPPSYGKTFFFHSIKVKELS